VVLGNITTPRRQAAEAFCFVGGDASFARLSEVMSELRDCKDAFRKNKERKMNAAALTYENTHRAVWEHKVMCWVVDAS
jgi:hypothetical protein